MIKKNYVAIVWLLATLINGLIALSVFSPKISALQTCNFSILPLLNAILNGLTFLSLLAARSAIKHNNIRKHRGFVFLAFSFTFLFLISYLTYHFSTPATKFGGTTQLRYIYLFILITHILLAAIIVPLAMYTMGLGLNGEIIKHRKAARWTMPIWLYVSLTGVIVYLIISPYYHT
jgi:putative membrane protein